MPMLSDTAEPRKRGIRARPCTKTRSDRCNDVAQFRKILVVETAAANQFPDPFDGIEFGAVRRQEVEGKMVGDFLAPPFVQTSVVVASIVDDHYNLSAAVSRDAFNPSVEPPAGASIEHPIRWRHDQFAILQAHSTKVTDALASRGMRADRVEDSRWNPHATAGAMLLEMHFIHSPQVNPRLSCQNAEFFYASIGVGGRLGQLVGAVCAVGNPTAERAAGTAELSTARHALDEDIPTRLVHPTSASQGRLGLERLARQPRLLSVDDRSIDWGVRVAVPRTGPPVRVFRIAEPSLRHCGANLPTVERLSGRSYLGQSVVLRGVDGRSAKRRCAVSHPGGP